MSQWGYAAPTPKGITPQTTQKKLAALSQSIEKLKQKVDSQKKQEAEALRQLDETQQKLAQATQLLDSLTKNLADKKRKVDKLNQSIHALVSQQIQAERQLEHIILLQLEQYQAQNNNLLSDNAQGLYKKMPVYHYYMKAQESRLKRLHYQLNNCKTLEHKVEKEKTVLNELHSKVVKKNTELKQEQVSTQKLLPKLNRAKTQTLAELRQKIEEQKHLEALLKKLRAQAAAKPAKVTINVQHPFAHAMGKLMLPIHQKNARLIKKANSKFMISSPNSAAVHAVYPGRVIFSNYLRGLGWLIIIDHGGGYMSLYGNNETLYKKTGEWVDIHDKIAWVDLRPGSSNAELYFEIRKEGRVLNIAKWIGPS